MHEQQKRTEQTTWKKQKKRKAKRMQGDCGRDEFVHPNGMNKYVYFVLA